MTYALYSAAFLVLLSMLWWIASKRSRTRQWERDRVIITGGCGNIGRAICRKLRAKGAQVWLLDTVCHHPEYAEHFVSCDVAEPDELERIVERLNGTILVNNCAVHSSWKAFTELTERDWGRIIKVNFFSYIRMTKAFISRLSKSKERHSCPSYIVNMSSCLGLVGVPYMTDYCASKFAVYGFNEALRMELRDKKAGIKTMIVCPFFVQNGLFPDSINIRFPWLTRRLNAEEVADAVLDGIDLEREEIWMPWFVNWVPIFRMLPVWLFDTCQRVLGTQNSF